MKRTVLLSLASIASVLATPVAAQSYPIPFSGNATVQKVPGPPLFCPFNITLNNSSDLTINNPSTSGACASFTINSNPHTYTLSGGVITVYGFDVTTTLTEGNCYGTLTGTLVDGVLTINNSSLQGGLDSNNLPTGDCTVSGVFEED